MALTTYTVAEHLVEPLRNAAYGDLYRASAEALAVVEVGERAVMRERLDGFLERIDGSRALLDALGWETPNEPFAVELDVRLHRAALGRAATHVSLALPGR